MRTLFFIIALAVLAAFGGQAAAQGVGVGVGVGMSLDVEKIYPRLAGGRFVYTVKFLCGVQPGPLPFGTGPLLPGIYRTVIDIYNPYYIAARFTKKAVETRTQQDPPRIGEPVEETLQAFGGLGITCQDIRLLIDLTPPLVALSRGFVVIETNRRLDVDAVYAVKNVEVIIQTDGGVDGGGGQN